MARKQLEEVVEWIVDGHLEEFKKDIGIIKKQFPNITDDNMEALKEIQKNGLANFDAEGEEDVTGQERCGRSYGWS